MALLSWFHSLSVGPYFPALTLGGRCLVDILDRMTNQRLAGLATAVVMGYEPCIASQAVASKSIRVVNSPLKFRCALFRPHREFKRLARLCQDF
eukprot:1793501-Amphidinium_carterae.1